MHAKLANALQPHGPLYVHVTENDHDAVEELLALQQEKVNITGSAASM
jgi:hypothetical protein